MAPACRRNRHAPLLHFITTLIEQPDGAIQGTTRELGRFKRNSGVFRDCESEKRKKRGRARNAPKFDLETRLFQMCGLDLKRINSIDVATALAVISATEAEMPRSQDVAHFASWIG